MTRVLATWIAAPLALCAIPAVAQDQPTMATAAPAAAGEAADAAAPPPPVIEVDPSKLKMPELQFTPTPADEGDYDKFFYFHREKTTFLEAYADIKECDALSSGISFYMRSDEGALAAVSAQYGYGAGAIGNAIGFAIADAIFGSAERRKMRRFNLRNCMAFKEYHRYPLSRALWTEFNFEEGLGRKKENVREEALQLQALVASGPKPTTKEMGL
jgi:hypothetical protein